MRSYVMFITAVRVPFTTEVKMTLKLQCLRFGNDFLGNANNPDKIT